MVISRKKVELAARRCRCSGDKESKTEHGASVTSKTDMKSDKWLPLASRYTAYSLRKLLDAVESLTTVFICSTSLQSCVRRFLAKIAYGHLVARARDERYLLAIVKIQVTLLLYRPEMLMLSPN